MKVFSTFIALLFAVQAFAFVTSTRTNSLVELEGMEVIGELPAEATALSANDFIALTPKKYEEMTGKKMGLINAFKLKAAQKLVKKHFKKGNDASIPQIVYIILALFGLAWLAMGIMDGFSGNNWWINLLLVLLFFLPGLIHALIVMKNYY